MSDLDVGPVVIPLHVKGFNFHGCGCPNSSIKNIYRQSHLVRINNHRELYERNFRQLNRITINHRNKTVFNKFCDIARLPRLPIYGNGT